MSFSVEDDEKIIDFVTNHECFYNVKCKDYKNSQLKRRLWCEIGMLINKPDVECSKRWIYMRDYYIRRRGKPGTGSCSEQAKKRSDLLSFLDSVPTSKRQTLTNVEIDNTEVITDAFDEGNAGTTQRTDQSGKDEGHPEQNRDTSPQIPTPPPRKRKNSNSEERLELLKQIAGRNSNHDEIDYFFLSVATAVKKLPKISQTKIRMEISQLLGREELAMLKSREETSADTDN